jgi:DNA-binding NtrC family response regulator
MSHDQTLRLDSLRTSEALHGVFRFRVRGGPDDGKTLALDDGSPSRLLVGRSPSCDLQLTQSGVSRRHLAIEIVDGRVRVTDLESTNGSSVNGLALGQVWLAGGETLRLGETLISVERAAEPGERTLSSATQFGRLLGRSREMRRLYPHLERLARSGVPVIIEGETGTGKELLAEVLHEQGPRAAGPFVVFDASTIPPGNVERELFGHEGAAGVAEPRAGVFEEAHKGTLVIDEIAELSLDVQQKLRRVIERGELRRVEGRDVVQVDVRVLATTRRDLDKEVQAGRFRDDLFHRLSVARIELPPLRQRRGDVTLLAATFLAQLGAGPGLLSDALLEQWEQAPWPGNVRELRNAVLRLYELGSASFIDDPTQSERSPNVAPAPVVADAVERVLALGLPMAEARRQLIDEFEARYVERVLAAHGGNVTRAAEASGVARRHFHRLLARQRSGR